MQAPKNMLSNLPDGHITQTWHNFRTLQFAINDVYKQLEKNDYDGNQLVVVLGLMEHAIYKLSNNRGALGGVGFRFMFEEAFGVIKVVAGAAHGLSTDTFTRMVDGELFLMGVRVPVDYRWGATTTHTASVFYYKGKQPDQCLYPAALAPTATGFNRWPTLVVETGVSESLPRLHADACWWFANSSGATRIVLVIAVGRQTRNIILQKWQLGPAGGQPHCSQVLDISISPQGGVDVMGAPLVLEFHEITGTQTNVSLGVTFLFTWARRVFRA